MLARRGQGFYEELYMGSKVTGLKEFAVGLGSAPDTNSGLLHFGRVR
jgi:hypothetical protein